MQVAQAHGGVCLPPVPFLLGPGGAALPAARDNGHGTSKSGCGAWREIKLDHTTDSCSFKTVAGFPWLW